MIAESGSFVVRDPSAQQQAQQQREGQVVASTDHFSAFGHSDQLPILSAQCGESTGKNRMRSVRPAFLPNGKPSGLPPARNASVSRQQDTDPAR